MSLIHRLQSVLGSRVVRPFVLDEMRAYLSDAIVTAAEGAHPIGIAWPESTEQVRQIVIFANETRVAVVPQGGRTGHACGGVPSRGCIVVSLERMNAIEDLDREGETLTVQAGAVLQGRPSTFAAAPYRSYRHRSEQPTVEGLRIG